MPDQPLPTYDSTAVRVALWRAQHLEVDSPPHVFEDDVGLKLAPPHAEWRQRPDMHPQWIAPFRAAIVGRARLIEDMLRDEIDRGVVQYVILGAGLDTFAQRRSDLAGRVAVFEVDQPGPQAWKRQRLEKLGFGQPTWLHFVPVNFEAGDDWLAHLKAAGFNAARPAVIASTGVSMYLTLAAIKTTLRQVASLPHGSTFAMSFLLPLAMADADMRPMLQRAVDGAQASGTPFVSFFAPDEILSLAKDAGFRDVRYVSADDLAARYFANRPDGLRPPRNAEGMLIATT
ncbi:class I SAM-dependent methyltransferase [Dongia rigui]|uniref:S-adenosyl-L-methionine-dependent methyltransferase n=1 Tax=Dongia rigui TaxID=940149 RepID=A0ABU5DUI8_9PROT|nr:class I SAM-dependent methyltransferase [Dongia rigui]MDY0870975.1 class I SAM-dependent methyltransferase [Dongia rigui]